MKRVAIFTVIGKYELTNLHTIGAKDHKADPHGFKTRMRRICGNLKKYSEL